MEYKIEYETIMQLAEEEVSREAGQAYSDDGSSLYDGIRMLSRDEDKKKRMMSEVLLLIKAQCNRFLRHADIVELEGEPISFQFELDLSPRRIAGKEHSLLTAFRSLTTNMFLNKYFVSKNLSDLATKYDAQAVADIQNLTKLLYEKVPPVYPKTYEQDSNDNNI